MHLQATRVQVQKPVFTASLEKSIAMLILPHAELAVSIEQELQNNPLLEAEYESTSEVDVDRMNALINLSFSKIQRSGLEEGAEFEPSTIEDRMTLEDHLLQQLYWEISDSLKRKIGEFIIGNLDREGFLHLSCTDIAQALNITDEHVVKEVLRIIQNFDPAGIATKDFKECLIVQLHSRQSPFGDLAIRIVEKYLDDLGNKRNGALAKKLSVSLEEISHAADLIASLEPKPARNYRPIDPTIYVAPDLYLRKNEDGLYTIETNKTGIPILRINQMYRNLLNQSDISDKDRRFIKEKINNAINFIRNIHQRGKTLTAVARYILNHQKEFFDAEDMSLKPMALKEVAEHLDRNESTISRAISNKYIDTPQGLFPLKFFFSHNASRQNHENVSAHTVKQELALLIKDEDKKAPFSDSAIQAHFNSKGVHLARRTIAKYRQMLNIPAAYLRK
ncbi:MAG: RNA polymerase factor sigma-54 [Candidatus Omnitrophica bacterium]|nr:RNA polymerase factor sigma-54 [Candidatus Omnitrophota bacterium]